MKPVYIMFILICLFSSCRHLPFESADDAAGTEEAAILSEEEETIGEEAFLTDETDEVPLEPLVEPPRPFRKDEIDARIVNLVYPGTFPVFRGGEVLALYEDFDANGYQDAGVLCIETDDSSMARFGVLSDSSRLYYQVLEPFTCSIQFFLQKNGKLYRSGIAPLGRKLVLESFQPIRLGEDPELPRGVAGVFKTRGGTEQEWVLFSTGNISRFTITESLSIIPVIDDINQDGIIDIVVHHQGFEEGSGYETFLIWYRWDGRQFMEYRSTNIVRNLNSFLQQSADFLLDGDWRGFCKFGLSAEDYAALEGRNMKEPAILKEIFYYETDSVEEQEGPDSSLQLLQVVFPSFYETPFTLEKAGRLEIPLQVRFVTADQKNYLSSAVVYMKRNPFEAEQFGFVLRE